MSALKDTIKELQAAENRFQEFGNETEKSINLEYLVNVLKKFLLTDNLSERSRLSIALTQILHMHTEEIQAVTEKWSSNPKNSGKGIVGWLTTPKKAPVVMNNPKDPSLKPQVAEFNPYADVNGYG